MKTALITGITGQDGSYLAELLLEKGYKVVGFLRRSTTYRHENIEHLIGKISLEFGDLMDAASIEHAMRKYNFDEIYNLAAQSVPADSWVNPIVTANITALGSLRMLEAARQYARNARFYQATSREILGGIDDAVIDENTPLWSNNPYGAAKLYAHNLVSIYRDSYDMFVTAGILFNHESPRRSLHFVTRKISMAVACIALGINNPPLNEHGEPLVQDNKVSLGNLDAVRDWGYAKEYAEAMWLMLQADNPDNYVIATNTVHTVRDFCKFAFDYVDLNWEDHVIVDEKFFRPTEIAASQGDYSKAKRELGWEPTIAFADLVALMVKSDIELLKK